MDTLGKILHVNFLRYSHWFMSIRISQMKNHSISVGQARCYTSIVAKNLYTDTIKARTKFYNTTLPYDTFFTKSDISTRDYQVDKLTREFNNNYRACIGSFIYL